MKTRYMTIPALLESYAAGSISPSGVIRSTLETIERNDAAIGAFLSVFPDEALAGAAELERGGMEGKPLYGIPVAVKDNICTRGLPTTCASRVLKGYRPPYDATVIGRLRGAGAVIVGKTNMDEFAMGSSCENSGMGLTRNPWDTTRAPGGSSGGSAAAVAAGMVPVALGSDTGGSIRQPASFCGVVGLKGTYGSVSRYGLVAFASSLDQIGPITRTVHDAAVVMQVISGMDERDATTMSGSLPDLVRALGEGLDGLRIGVPAGIDRWGTDPAVEGIIAEAAGLAAGAGAGILPIELPDLDAAIACYYVLATAEASSNLARYDGVRYGARVAAESLKGMYDGTREAGFGEEVKRRILLGTFVLSSGYYEAYYGKAQRVRAMIRAHFDRLFREADVLLMPASPGGAFRLGERTADPIKMYLSDIFTTPASIAGLPAISIPGGTDSDGMPIGIQLVAGSGREDLLVRCAAGFERMLGFDGRPSADAKEEM